MISLHSFVLLDITIKLCVQKWNTNVFLSTLPSLIFEKIWKISSKSYKIQRMIYVESNHTHVHVQISNFKRETERNFFSTHCYKLFIDIISLNGAHTSDTIEYCASSMLAHYTYLWLKLPLTKVNWLHSALFYPLFVFKNAFDITFHMMIFF